MEFGGRTAPCPREHELEAGSEADSRDVLTASAFRDGSEGAPHRLEFGVFDEDPVDPVADDVARPTPVERHNRRTRGEGLDHRETEVLFADVHEATGALVQRRELLPRRPAA